jgi:hypothetical protein
MVLILDCCHARPSVDQVSSLDQLFGSERDNLAASGLSFVLPAAGETYDGWLKYLQRWVDGSSEEHDEVSLLSSGQALAHAVMEAADLS